MEQPVHGIGHQPTNHQGPDGFLAQQAADDHIRSGRPAGKKTSTVMAKRRGAIFRVKYADDEGNLSTSNDDDVDGRPCSSADDPPAPNNAPSRPRPGFNPTGW